MAEEHLALGGWCKHCCPHLCWFDERLCWNAHTCNSRDSTGDEYKPCGLHTRTRSHGSQTDRAPSPVYTRTHKRRLDAANSGCTWKPLGGRDDSEVCVFLTLEQEHSCVCYQ